MTTRTGFLGIKDHGDMTKLAPSTFSLLVVPVNMKVWFAAQKRKPCLLYTSDAADE